MAACAIAVALARRGAPDGCACRRRPPAPAQQPLIDSPGGAQRPASSHPPAALVLGLIALAKTAQLPDDVLAQPAPVLDVAPPYAVHRLLVAASLAQAVPVAAVLVAARGPAAHGGTNAPAGPGPSAALPAGANP